LKLLEILHEDSDLLVVHKPAGLVCHPTKGDAWSSLVSRVRLHLGGVGEPQMVHRLDRETSGVMIFGKTPETALELRRLWEGGFVAKEYLAVVHKHLAQDAGVIDEPLGRDEASEVSIKDCVRSDGARAVTCFRVVRRFHRGEGDFTLLRLFPGMGRKHQLRIHLAHLGHPVVGDKLYGGDERLYLDFVQRRLTTAQQRQLILQWQALHAARLWLPWGGVEREFTSPPEPWFRAFAEGAPVAGGEDPYDPQRPSCAAS